MERSTFEILPLGDQAALVYLADEGAAFAFAESVRQSRQTWLVDVVQAYTSVGVYFDLDLINFRSAAEDLRRLIVSDGKTAVWHALRYPEGRGYQPGLSSTPFGVPEGVPPDVKIRRHRIPCCYEMQSDLKRVAKLVHLSLEEVIRLHAETEYTVYAIGFCPGFPYLGYLPAALCGVPRLPTPRLKVEAGSVGLTGRQTGIYTESRPGGWNIIGQTPLELVNVAEAYFPLRTGDRVRFERIDETAFEQMRGQRLKA